MTPEQISEIDGRLALWRQGDVVFGADVPFVHLADLSSPTTPEAAQLAKDSEEAGLATVSVDGLGLVVLTQTCDLVRSCQDRPYVEVCLLVEIPADQVELVRLGRVPRFAVLPALENKKVAADLDRVMTIEKGLLVSISGQRASGVSSEAEALALAETLGRKRTRAALPNDFTAAVAPMRKRILEKHNRDSDEGRFLRTVKEIRVRALPDWISLTIEVEFLFIFERAANIPASADQWVSVLMARVIKSDRIPAVEGRAVGLDQLSAASYLDSCRLDLDHLSQSS